MESTTTFTPNLADANAILTRFGFVTSGLNEDSDAHMLALELQSKPFPKDLAEQDREITALFHRYLSKEYVALDSKRMPDTSRIRNATEFRAAVKLLSPLEYVAMQPIDPLLSEPRGSIAVVNKSASTGVLAGILKGCCSANPGARMATFKKKRN